MRSILVAQRIAPWMSENLVENLQPLTPRICWLPEAVHHPVLLHATLLAAGVYLNRMLHNNDLIIVIWLKIQTLHMLNEGLGEASDELIVCVLIVLYFTVSGTWTCYASHIKQ